MGERGGGRAQEHYARALCCNTAGPFQICFLRACAFMQYFFVINIFEALCVTVYVLREVLSIRLDEANTDM